MGRYVFNNVKIFDGTDPELHSGSVLVEGNRVETVQVNDAQPGLPFDADIPDAVVIDGHGATLMPGLIEPHGHISFPNGKSIDFTAMPVEEAMLQTVRNAKTVLDCGYTSVFSAASMKPRLDIVLKREIQAGRVPGPRYLACSPELTVTGGLGDTNHLHLPFIQNTTFSWVVDGPDEIRRAVRTFAREGVDNVKVHLSGDLGPSSAASPNQTPMAEAEIDALVEVARANDLRLVCHARSALSVLTALRHGIGIINHANYVDEPALDALEEAKDWVVVIPAVGLTNTLAHDAAEWGMAPDRVEGFKHELEVTIRAVEEMRKRGIRVLPGGDYGFAYMPHGLYANDLALFVKLLGFSPAETLTAATRYGGHVMGKPEELGVIKAGALADMLLVDGDPIADISILQNRDSISMIMKDGELHKAPIDRMFGASRGLPAREVFT
jgi:imidazolonepropionase-like amidohydrolase